MSTRHSSAARSPGSVTAARSRSAGLRRPPTRAHSSRARPRWPRQSGRLAGTEMSSTASPASPRASLALWPSGVRASSPTSTQMPEWSSPRPSSFSEHSMPADSTPLSGRTPISIGASVPPSPSRAPGRAHRTRPPGAGTLGAPHTTRVAVPPGWSITSTMVSLSALGCFSRPTTSATTTPAKPCAQRLEGLDLEAGAGEQPRALFRARPRARAR